MSENLDEFGRLAMLKAVMDAIKPVEADARDAARAKMKPGDRRAARFGDVKLGAVSLSDPTLQARVVDERQFIAWVDANHRTEVSTVWELVEGVSWQDVAAKLHEFDPGLAAVLVQERPVVNPAFEKRVLAETAVGDVVPPGVEVTLKSPVLRVNLQPVATERARALLSGAAMPELEAGE